MSWCRTKYGGSPRGANAPGGPGIPGCLGAQNPLVPLGAVGAGAEPLGLASMHRLPGPRERWCPGPGCTKSPSPPGGPGSSCRTTYGAEAPGASLGACPLGKWCPWGPWLPRDTKSHGAPGGSGGPGGQCKTPELVHWLPGIPGPLGAGAGPCRVQGLQGPQGHGPWDHRVPRSTIPWYPWGRLGSRYRTPGPWGRPLGPPGALVPMGALGSPGACEHRNP